MTANPTPTANPTLNPTPTAEPTPVDPPTAPGVRLRQADPARVRLLPGPFAERAGHAAGVYGGLSPADVLKGFRRNAGQPAPGNDLGGWASRTTEATFGQWVGGLARLAHTLGDTTLAARAVELADGWAATLPADGDARMATYGWEKAACGLVDVAEYAGHQDALRALSRITEAAARTFDRTRSPATRTDRDGRLPYGTLEWYTLAENPYRAFTLTGDTSFRDFAELWHYDAYWDAFATRPEPGQPWDVPVWLHAYSHVNTFCSAAEAYVATGDRRMLDIARNGLEWTAETQSYATGGYGPGEWSVPDDGSLGRALEWRTDSAEIPCDTWAVFKLTRRLLPATGQAAHAELAERLLFNGIGASLPIRPDGRSYYYADYRLGGQSTKLRHWDAWPCCSGTYLQAVAAVPDLIFWPSDDGIAVAQFLPAEIRWSHAGQEVTLRQHTLFPETDTTELRVESDSPVTLTLRVRIPSWSEGFGLRVNGEPVAGWDAAYGWALVTREWQPGDRLQVTLGATLRAEAVDRFHPERAALLHGPVVLAQEGVFSSPFALPGAAADPTLLAAALTRVDPDDGDGPFAPRLRYQPTDRGAEEQPVGPFRALAGVKERWPHRVYHDLNAPRFL
ncbi:beta-L-arabinofuranosidase domain-containing protein [Streptomyces sp. NBRC 109706]|uniref:beta-L-arabinofuranosidase domain-containing protein n=1 Tax=Streptomyces sp. NBRC 109706 TaxID=1550035 RepID=UPI0007862974|nr:beta-L-arabinofuranosidase domain-containing protein [Streptomyces sp. NBRC 109706]